MKFWSEYSLPNVFFIRLCLEFCGMQRAGAREFEEGGGGRRGREGEGGERFRYEYERKKLAILS